MCIALIKIDNVYSLYLTVKCISVDHNNLFALNTMALNVVTTDVTSKDTLFYKARLFNVQCFFIPLFHNVEKWLNVF